MAIRPTARSSSSAIVRLCISNDAGNLLNMHMYKEVTDPQTGVIKFVSLFSSAAGSSSGPGDHCGPWHGLPVSTPYMTKDFLEAKRSKAQALETTYVYDFPDIFKVGAKSKGKVTDYNSLPF
jgi:acetyl-CoA carboxylase/biotin carboxylase 1